jgi:hypothetical protein
MVLALTTLGHSGIFDHGWRSPIARALKQQAQQLSERLGFRADA